MECINVSFIFLTIIILIIGEGGSWMSVEHAITHPLVVSRWLTTNAKKPRERERGDKSECKKIITKTYKSSNFFVPIPSLAAAAAARFQSRSKFEGGFSLTQKRWQQANKKLRNLKNVCNKKNFMLVRRVVKRKKRRRRVKLISQHSFGFKLLKVKKDVKTKKNGIRLPFHPLTCPRGYVSSVKYSFFSLKIAGAPKKGKRPNGIPPIPSVVCDALISPHREPSISPTVSTSSSRAAIVFGNIHQSLRRVLNVHPEKYRNSRQRLYSRSQSPCSKAQMAPARSRSIDDSELKKQKHRGRGSLTQEYSGVTTLQVPDDTGLAGLMDCDLEAYHHCPDGGEYLFTDDEDETIPSEIVTINVSGMRFQTRETTLKRFVFFRNNKILQFQILGIPKRCSAIRSRENDILFPVKMNTFSTDIEHGKTIFLYNNLKLRYSISASNPSFIFTKAMVKLFDPKPFQSMCF